MGPGFVPQISGPIINKRTDANPFPSILLAALFHIGLTALIYRGIDLTPSSQVIAGQQVGGYFTWLFWWWRYALAHHLPLFHSNFIMYPAGVPLFPHSPVNEIPALLLQAVASPSFATNFLFLSSHVLTGVAMFLLAKDITKNNWASLCASVVYAYSAYAITQCLIGQLIEATLFFNPLLVLAARRHLRSPTAGSAWLFAGALLGVFFSGPYVGFCFGLIFCLSAVIFDVTVGSRAVLDRRISRPLL